MPEYEYLVSAVKNLVNKYNELINENEKLKLMLATRGICPKCGGKVIVTKTPTNVVTEVSVDVYPMLVFRCTKCNWLIMYEEKEFDRIKSMYQNILGNIDELNL